MEQIIKVISDTKFLSAVCSTLIIIFLSFFLTRKNIIKPNAKDVISDLVLKLALPAMAFTAFMKDLDTLELNTSFQVVLLGLFIYLFLIIGLKFLFDKVILKNTSKETKDVYQMIIIFGNVTFFTTPIIEGYYGDSIIIPEYFMIIVFRVFLYSYAYFVMSGIKFEKKHIGDSAKKILLNPIVLCTLIGLLIWSLQNVLPQVNIDGKDVCIFRIDETLTFIYAPISYLAKIATPLSWILIGITIGELSFKEAFKNKKVWILSLIRTTVVPLFVLGLVILLQYTNIINLTKYGFAACVLTLAAPLSVVINTYGVKYNREPYLVSDTCLISTLIGMLSIPILVVVVELIGNTSLFI